MGNVCISGVIEESKRREILRDKGNIKSEQRGSLDKIKTAKKLQHAKTKRHVVSGLAAKQSALLCL